MPSLPKLNTSHLNEKGSEQPLSASALASPSNVTTRPPFTSHDSTKSRERTKLKGVIDKFMGNFNGIGCFIFYKPEQKR